jgi:hypothetical protein
MLLGTQRVCDRACWAPVSDVQVDVVHVVHVVAVFGKVTLFFPSATLRVSTAALEAEASRFKT